MNRVAQSYLYAPAHKSPIVEKALSGRTGADAAIVDLEDGVPVDERPAAEATLRALAGAAPASIPVLCRLRAGTAARAADVQLVPSWFSGVLLAKAEDADDLLRVSEQLTVRGLTLPIWLLVESARGVENLPQLLSLDIDLRGVMLGAGDLGADLGLFDTEDHRALDYARLRMVYAARARGLSQIIDGPSAEIDPGDVFRATTQGARDLGFTGRAAIHPSQLATIHAVYHDRFSDEQRAWARDVIALEDGAQAHNGQLVDEAVKRWAGQILQTEETKQKERTS